MVPCLIMCEKSLLLNKSNCSSLGNKKLKKKRKKANFFSTFLKLCCFAESQVLNVVLKNYLKFWTYKKEPDVMYHYNMLIKLR